MKWPWEKKRKPLSEVAPKVKARLSQLPRHVVVAYLNTSLYDTGRALTAYEGEMTTENFDAVELAAALIPALIDELRERHDAVQTAHR